MKNMIKVTCYDNKMVFKTRNEAVKFFEEAMMACDPFSSEWLRYGDIINKINMGKTEVTDDYLDE